MQSLADSVASCKIPSSSCLCCVADSSLISKGGMGCAFPFGLANIVVSNIVADHHVSGTAIGLAGAILLANMCKCLLVMLFNLVWVDRQGVRAPCWCALQCTKISASAAWTSLLALKLFTGAAPGHVLSPHEPI